MKRVATKTLIFLSYFLGTFILRKIDSFAISLSFLKSSMWELTFWLMGVILGAHFLKLDQLFYVYFTKPEDQLSLEVKELIGQKRMTEVWDLLDTRVEEQRLVSRSVLFQIGWVVLAFFTLTSTAGLFGKVLVMAIGLHLLLEEWEDVLTSRGISWLFWPIKREVSLREQKWFLWGMTGVFVILTFLLL